MKRIIDFSIKNKLAIWILTLFIIILGVYSGNSMKLETLPNINEPVVDITTIYSGASPNEVLKSVTNPLEQRISNLEGVENVTSTSLEGASSIQVEYNLKKNMEEAENEIKDALQSVTLPPNTNNPEVKRVSFNDLPVLVLSLKDSERALEELSDIASSEIKNDFEAIEGISEVKIIGGDQKEVEITFSPEKLEEYRLSEENLIEYIKTVSEDASLGLQIVDDQEQSLIFKKSVESKDDLPNLLIPIPVGNSNDAISIELEEIATIDEVTKKDSVSRINGEDAIGIQIYKSNDGNTVQVVDAVKEKMASAEEKFNTIEFSSVLNEGDPIKDSVELMFHKALMGAAFAMLIILIFLRNFKTTIIAIVSIPLSLVIALIFLNQMNITLNLMTLGAMTVAIGRVVDDSIVVIENIYRRMILNEEVLKGAQLIKEATAEMFSPVVSSTIVTIAVFFPLGLIDGPVGELFYPFGLTIVLSLLASLVVSITLVPMMAHFLLKKKNLKPEKQKKKKSTIYLSFLKWCLNHKIVSFVAINLLLVSSLLLLPMLGVSFIPGGQSNTIIASYNPLPGSTNNEIINEVEKAEDILLNREHIQNVQASFGNGNPLNPSDAKQVLFIINYNEELADITGEEDTVGSMLKEENSGEWDIQSTGSGNNQLALYVYGDDILEVNASLKKIEEKLLTEKELTGLKTSSSDELKQLGFTLKPDKMASLNIQPVQVYQALNLVPTETLTTFTEGENVLPLRIHKAEDGDTSKAMLDRTIVNAANEKIKLGEVVTLSQEVAPASITKRNGEVYGAITANITSKDVTETTEDIQNQIKELNFPESIKVEFGGVVEQIDESFNQMAIAIGSAIFIVYFVLVVTFGGGLAPLAILSSLPYIIIGSLVGLMITNEPISISVMIGVLMLIGIVVTNAIVFVDRIIQKQKENFGLRQAILEAGATRLRPILMTALATIGALLPLVISDGGEGSGLISKGLGVTVIGGLISSTLITLIIVPLVYESLMLLKNKLIREKVENG